MDSCRDLVRKGQIKEALQCLENLQSVSFADEVAQLQGRLAQLEQAELMGIISTSEAGIERNKITAFILSLCAEAKNTGDATEPNAPGTTNSVSITGDGNTIIQGSSNVFLGAKRPSSVTNSTSFNKSNIFKLMNSAFNDDGLQTFCAIHFEEVYNNFTNGQSKSQRILALMDYANRQLKMPELLSLVQAESPAQFDQHQPYQ